MAVSAQRILETLKERLTSLTEGKDVAADTDLVGDLGLDSLQIMELLMEMEDSFDVSIPVNVIADARTVGDLVLAVQKLLN
ncbi:MAG: acyl carrier protein [Immundisolibacter sp.]|uniref:acyl carrier protein n=1 Tax=Immundisolibacter sp. TaxID=1934948 RepID=UPI003EE05C41